MCYSLYISTDSTEDLTELNSELVRFEKITGSIIDPCIQLLGFPNQWYVGSKTGCSCTFRHLYSIELGFSEPEDWYPEEQDELDATGELYDTFSRLLSAGYRIDCLDSWVRTEPNDIRTIVVSLNEISKKAFRLFENHRFILKEE